MRELDGEGRNPLSLDMGWKAIGNQGISAVANVAIRFRWIWVEKWKMWNQKIKDLGRNPLSLDMGWKGC